MNNRPRGPVRWKNDTVRVFVGTDPRMRQAEIALEHSLRKYSSLPVEITWMDYSRGGLWKNWNIGREPGQPYTNRGWTTNFTCFRFAIPEAAAFEGLAIYLDVDMILLKDIALLLEHPLVRPISITPHGYDVMLLDCSAFSGARWWPHLEEMRHSGWNVQPYHDLLLKHGCVQADLPKDWDCCDGDGFDSRSTALLHFTDMFTQPWKPYPDILTYREHPRPAMVRLWEELYAEAMAKTR